MSVDLETNAIFYAGEVFIIPEDRNDLFYLYVLAGVFGEIGVGEKRREYLEMIAARLQPLTDSP